MPTPQPPSSCKVYTPVPLASAMVNSIFQHSSQRWLEPGCGTGAFLEAMDARGVPRQKIVGVDLDTRRSAADRIGNITRGVDFLTWSMTRSKRFDCVVGNPPYVAINRLPEELRLGASKTPDFNGAPVGIKANTWYPFLVQAIRLLRDGGNLAFVLPAASEFANYSEAGRSVLTKLFDRVDVIRSRSPLFDEVSEGSVVLIGRNKGGGSQLYRRHEVDDLNGVVERLRKIDDLTARKCPNARTHRSSTKTVQCSEVFDVRIGGVTGDASYFVLSESKRLEHDLPKSAMIPVVSRGRHIGFSVQRQRIWEELKDSDERVWLFRPKNRSLRHAAVQRYLQLSDQEGGCHKQRFKIRNRNPWYSTILPERADAFISGMSTAGPWMCMNEMPTLAATNTVYVIKFRGDHSRAERYAWALSMLTSPVRKQVARATRIYADGLSKVEPGQIGNIDLPVPPMLPDAVSLYQQACSLLLRGKKDASQQIANDSILVDSGNESKKV